MPSGNKLPQKESLSPFLQETTGLQDATIPTASQTQRKASRSVERLRPHSTSPSGARTLTTPEPSRLSGMQPTRARRHLCQLLQRDTFRKFHGTIHALRLV